MAAMDPRDVIEPGWEPIAELLRASIDRGDDVGASVAVFHRGRPVVDIAAGRFARDDDRPYDHDTLQLVFSTTKGITAIAVAMCVQRGLLDYHAPVSRYWPEFAAEGKDAATVAQLLSHQCGLITVDGITLEETLQWETVTSRLAATAPDWPIGSGHGYHALSYGWLAGELVRRVDGRSLGTFVQEEISQPRGVDLWIGLPEDLEPRVSPLIGGSFGGGDGGDGGVDPATRAMLEAFLGPGTRAGRALTMSGAYHGDGLFNRREVHAAEIPAANCITNASALATVYAATLGEVNGVRLLGEATRDAAVARQTPPKEADLCLVMPTAFSMGFMVYDITSPYAGPGSYGHPGAGGSVAFAQPARQLAMAYAMNRMAPNLMTDRRTQNLIDAAARIADAQA